MLTSILNLAQKNSVGQSTGFTQIATRCVFIIQYFYIYVKGFSAKSTLLYVSA